MGEGKKDCSPLPQAGEGLGERVRKRKPSPVATRHPRPSMGEGKNEILDI